MEKILAAIFTFFKHDWSEFSFSNLFSSESFLRDLEQLTLAFQCSARLNEKVEFSSFDIINYFTQDGWCGNFYIIVGLISLAFIITDIRRYRKPNNKKNKKELIIGIVIAPLMVFVATSMFFNIIGILTFFMLFIILIGLILLLVRVAK